nr:type II secretion system protein [Candidatus Pacearchaeota archaeon]
MTSKIKKRSEDQNQSGFTLIEILVVIGLIAFLAAVVIIAINPARQFAQGRNSQRVSNVNAILNAIGQRIADNKGLF